MFTQLNISLLTVILLLRMTEAGEERLGIERAVLEATPLMEKETREAARSRERQ